MARPQRRPAPPPRRAPGRGRNAPPPNGGCPVRAPLGVAPPTRGVAVASRVPVSSHAPWSRGHGGLERAGGAPDPPRATACRWPLETAGAGTSRPRGALTLGACRRRALPPQGHAPTAQVWGHGARRAALAGPPPDLRIRRGKPFTCNLNRAADNVCDTMTLIPMRREGQGQGTLQQLSCSRGTLGEVLLR